MSPNIVFYMRCQMSNFLALSKCHLNYQFCDKICSFLFASVENSIEKRFHIFFLRVHLNEENVLCKGRVLFINEIYEEI